MYILELFILVNKMIAIAHCSLHIHVVHTSEHQTRSLYEVCIGVGRTLQCHVIWSVLCCWQDSPMPCYMKCALLLVGLSSALLYEMCIAVGWTLQCPAIWSVHCCWQDSPVPYYMKCALLLAGLASALLYEICIAVGRTLQCPAICCSCNIMHC